jgi:hypothetical protein
MSVTTVVGDLIVETFGKTNGVESTMRLKKGVVSLEGVLYCHACLVVLYVGPLLQQHRACYSSDVLLMCTHSWLCRHERKGHACAATPWRRGAAAAANSQDQAAPAHALC